MPRDSVILDAAGAVIAEQNVELNAIRARQLLAVGAKSATGSGNMNALFSVDVRFRLIFVRCHFTGTAGLAPLSIAIDSGAGSAFDTLLYTITKAGPGRDVHFRLGAEEASDPSSWTFQAGDALRLQWTDPTGGGITWGLEVGLAMAS